MPKRIARRASEPAKPGQRTTRAGAELLQRLRAELSEIGDPQKALAMQRYMKSALPYHGVPMPALRATCRQLFGSMQFDDARAWSEAVLALWSGAAFREERYAALFLCGLRSARAFQRPAAMKLYERMIVEGAWWDVVDELAVRRVGPIVLGSPAVMKPMMLRWSHDANLWKRRSALLCQIGFKQQTDLDLLYACIEPSIDAKEFFLRKAIGWALRSYAWTDAREVIRFVRQHKQELSPLSKREALKNALRSGLIAAVP